MDCPTDWSPWPSEREPTRHVVGSSDSSNPWEQPIHRYPTVGGTSYQYTEVSLSGPIIVFEQAHVHTTFGGNLSYHPSRDDDVYIPQFESPQPSIYGQGMDVQAMTSWLSTTTISSPLFTHSTPSSMPMMDDQLNEDEQTLDHPHPRRIVQVPRRYDQTSSLHRQELPRRRRG
ncbi:hypothetical protein V6N13_047395 [Hibiscus sabdariffa]